MGVETVVRSRLRVVGLAVRSWLKLRWLFGVCRPFLKDTSLLEETLEVT